MSSPATEHASTARAGVGRSRVSRQFLPRADQHRCRAASETASPTRMILAGALLMGGAYLLMLAVASWQAVVPRPCCWGRASPTATRRSRPAQPSSHRRRAGPRSRSSRSRSSSAAQWEPPSSASSSRPAVTERCSSRAASRSRFSDSPLRDSPRRRLPPRSGPTPPPRDHVAVPFRSASPKGMARLNGLR